MIETIYSIEPGLSGTYAVLVRHGDGRDPLTRSGFLTEAAANSWIAGEQRKTLAADDRDRLAPESWQD
jgi:hypothetical protein